MKSVQIRSFFWYVFSCIRTEYGALRSKSSYSIRIRENMDQKKLCIWIIFTQWTFFRLHFSRPRTKAITYRNYKKFHEEKILNDLKEAYIIKDEKAPNQNYQFLTKTFLTFVNKHASSKKRIARGNQDSLWLKNSKKQFTLDVDWKTKWTKILP